jgi:hypothetical protein
VRFTIRYSRSLAVLMTLLGMGPRSSGATVTDDEVRVRMGFWFSATIPLRSITEAGRRGYVWAGYGVHFVPRGPWIVNGSGHNVVRIVIDPPVRARAVGVNVELRELWISLEDPDGFLAAIGH